MLFWFRWMGGSTAGAAGFMGAGQWAQPAHGRSQTQIVLKLDVEPLSAQPGRDPEAQ